MKTADLPTSGRAITVNGLQKYGPLEPRMVGHALGRFKVQVFSVFLPFVKSFYV